MSEGSPLQTALYFAESGEVVTDREQIAADMRARGLRFETWPAPAAFAPDAAAETVLAAYAAPLRHLMETEGYASADVVVLHAAMDNVRAIREKFLSEHTHSEDEVRFFVEGSGEFWFHLENEVFALRCVAGDFISVPAGVPHWFDCGQRPFVKAIRVFSDTAGWTPHYAETATHRSYIGTFGAAPGQRATLMPPGPQGASVVDAIGGASAPSSTGARA